MSLELNIEMVSKWNFTDEDVAEVLIEFDLIDEELYERSKNLFSEKIDFYNKDYSKINILDKLKGYSESKKELKFSYGEEFKAIKEEKIDLERVA